MKRLFRDIGGRPWFPHGSVVCMGGFDGVHLGHRHLLARVRDRARVLGLPGVAICFEPLPKQFFQGKREIARLLAPRQRIDRILRDVDALGMLRFDAALAATSAEEFIREALVGCCHAREVWVGPGFRFGKGRAGNIELLRQEGERHGFSAHEIDAFHLDSETASATKIRAMLGEGLFAQASRMLGYDYGIGGRVVFGKQLGRKLGYPTANLRLPWGRSPVQGIFAAYASGAGLARWPAVASLGTRPTVQGTEPLLEAHLFGFDGDLYGKLLTVEFVAKIRDEQCFSSLDELVKQIDLDAARAQELLAAAQGASA